MRRILQSRTRQKRVKRAVGARRSDRIQIALDTNDEQLTLDSARAATVGTDAARLSTCVSRSFPEGCCRYLGLPLRTAGNGPCTRWLYTFLRPTTPKIRLFLAVWRVSKNRALIETEDGGLPMNSVERRQAIFRSLDCKGPELIRFRPGVPLRCRSAPA
jgi:hypothetical protein